MEGRNQSCRKKLRSPGKSWLRAAQWRGEDWLDSRQILKASLWGLLKWMGSMREKSRIFGLMNNWVNRFSSMAFAQKGTLWDSGGFCCYLFDLLSFVVVGRLESSIWTC